MCLVYILPMFYYFFARFQLTVAQNFISTFFPDSNIPRPLISSLKRFAFEVSNNLTVRCIKQR